MSPLAFFGPHFCMDNAFMGAPAIDTAKKCFNFIGDNLFKSFPYHRTAYSNLCAMLHNGVEILK